MLFSKHIVCKMYATHILYILKSLLPGFNSLQQINFEFKSPVCELVSPIHRDLGWGDWGSTHQSDPHNLSQQ